MKSTVRSTFTIALALGVGVAASAALSHTRSSSADVETLVASEPRSAPAGKLAERGVPFMEIVNLEEVARDRVYTFAFTGAPLKLRGASGAPMRPIAIPLEG